MTLTLQFSIPRRDFTIDINQQLSGDKVTAIFGPSGCGKTSLLRAIAGLDKHKNARLSVNGEVWQDQQRFLPPYQRSVGYVFQEASLFSHLNVLQNLQYGLKRVDALQRRIGLEQAIELLHIGPLLQSSVGALSGGERQRVAIARAIAVSPQILLMDEPLSAVDHSHKQQIMSYIESLHQSLTIPILYVSHSLEEVAQLSDDLLLMQRGQVSASGPTRQLLSRLDSPLSDAEDAATIIETIASGYDAHYHLSQLQFDGGVFNMARQFNLNDKVKLRVMAKDVSIALTEPQATSILNVFAASITAIRQQADGQSLIQLQLGEQTMLSRVTTRSVDLLKLQPGMHVFAQVKAISLL